MSLAVFYLVAVKCISWIWIHIFNVKNLVKYDYEIFLSNTLIHTKNFSLKVVFAEVSRMPRKVTWEDPVFWMIKLKKVSKLLLHWKHKMLHFLFLEQ